MRSKIVWLLPLAFAVLTLPVPRAGAFDGTVRPKLDGTVRPKLDGTVRPKLDGTVRPKLDGTVRPKLA